MAKVLSVIIPAYNVERYIEECLESFCICKSDSRVEIIVIDDGSTDGTLAKAKQYETKYPDLFRTIHKSNGGHGSVINRGISEARGKYIKIVDGDDFVDQDTLIQFVDKLEVYDVDVVMHNEIDFYQNSTIIKEDTVGDIEYEKIYLASEIEPSWKYEMAKSCLHSRILKNVHYPTIDEKCFYVDQEFVVYTLPYIKSLIAFNIHLYHYRLGNVNQSVSVVNKFKHRDDLHRVICSILTFYESIPRDTIQDNILKRINTKIAEQIVIYSQVILLSMDASRKDYQSVRSLYLQIKNDYYPIFEAMIIPKSLRLFIVIPNFMYSSLIKVKSFLNGKRSNNV